MVDGHHFAIDHCQIGEGVHPALPTDQAQEQVLSFDPHFSHGETLAHTYQQQVKQMLLQLVKQEQTRKIEDQKQGQLAEAEALVF